MKLIRLIAMLFLATCESAAPAPTPAVATVPPAPAPASEAEPPIPTEEDFEAAAQAAISEANLDGELDALEREIGD